MAMFNCRILFRNCPIDFSYQHKGTASCQAQLSQWQSQNVILCVSMEGRWQQHPCIEKAAQKGVGEDEMVTQTLTWVALSLGRPEGMPRASSSAELMEAAATALARLRGGRSACAMIFSSRTICAATRARCSVVFVTFTAQAHAMACNNA